MIVERTTPVCVKLTKTEREFLDKMTAKHGYLSRSSAIRAALGMWMERAAILPHEEMAIERERKASPPRAHAEPVRRKLRDITARKKEKT